MAYGIGMDIRMLERVLSFFHTLTNKFTPVTCMHESLKFTPYRNRDFIKRSDKKESALVTNFSGSDIASPLPRFIFTKVHHTYTISPRNIFQRSRALLTDIFFAQRMKEFNLIRNALTQSLCTLLIC